MSQSNALRFDDLSEAAASVADTSLVVRARFVEAADTMLHIDVSGLRPAALKAFWPEHILDYTEIRLRYRPSSSAISRAEEVMYDWLLKFVPDEERRVLLGKWSMCLAAPHIAGSFRQFCQRTGRVRRTAERRLFNQFQVIAAEIIKIPQLLQQPDWQRVSPMMPNSATDLAKVETPVAASSTHWLPADAIPFHDPSSPDLAKLIKRLERANKKRQQAA